MNTKYFALIATIVMSLLTGCATPSKMPLANDSDTIKAGSPPIFLMTATLKNDYRQSYQPDASVVLIEKPDAKEMADRLNFLIRDAAQKYWAAH